MATGGFLQKHLPSTAFVLLLLILVAAFGGIFIYAGFYNIGADAPHSGLVYSVLQELRDRSVANRSRSIQPPGDLNSPKRVAAGAGLYAEMCTGCHLGPGVEKSEMSQGLYPQAPELARGTDLTPAQHPSEDSPPPGHEPHEADEGEANERRSQEEAHPASPIERCKPLA